MRRRGPIGRRSGGTAREQTFASPFPNAYTFRVDVLATGGGFAGRVVYVGMWTPNVFYPLNTMVSTGSIFEGQDFWIEANSAGTTSTPGTGVDWHHVGPTNASGRHRFSTVVARITGRLGLPPLVPSAGQPLVLGLMAVSTRGEVPAWMSDFTRDSLNTVLSNQPSLLVFSKQKIDFLSEKRGLGEIEIAELLGIAKMVSASSRRWTRDSRSWCRSSTSKPGSSRGLKRCEVPRSSASRCRTKRPLT